MRKDEWQKAGDIAKEIMKNIESETARKEALEFAKKRIKK